MPRHYAHACWAAAALAVGAGLARAETISRTEAQIAAELANPLAPVTTLTTQYRVEFGNGPNDNTNQQLRVQPSFFVPFADKSALLVRTILPLRRTLWPTDDAGLADISIVPYYVPDVTTSTFVGYGGALVLPTATRSALGSGKASAGPAVLFAQTGQPVTWGGLAQHVWSFGGQSSRPQVSVTTLQPFVTYLLGAGWSATLTTESTYNWQAAPADRWTVPLAASVAKVVDVAGAFFNVGVGFVEYLQRPSFAPARELRLTVTYVFG